MHWIQKKMMDYHHGYFMGVGLGLFLFGFAVQVFLLPEGLRPESFQLLTVIGALLLGYGTGRCDQKACN
ncbi:hypothetical protein AQV86_04750 [Nanohaloarchaea archaeon SG9]|nr:hypothetical protein AQV86_04750 [Nanohaloarchaea archaeon SG9]